MPQLDAYWYASQIFWLIVFFSLLYWLLSRRALPRVAEILEARQDRIAADLDQAQRLRAEAEDTLAQYEATMVKAREQAHALLAETQAKLQAEASERQSDLEHRLARELAAAEARIAEAKQGALKELEEAAVVAAQAAAERLVGVKVTKKAAQAALREIRREAA